MTNEKYPFWFGGLACSFASLCTHPQDLLKVQLQNHKLRKGPGLVKTAQTILKQQGFLALYDGIGAALLRQMTYSTIRFGCYDRFKSQFQGPDGKVPFYGLVASAVLAGCVGGGFGNPFDVINVRMQSDRQLPEQMQRKYKNVLEGFFRIIKEEGSSTLLRGLRTSMVRSVIMTVSQLGSYDVIKTQLMSTKYFEEDLKTHFVTSLLAGIVATTACSPIDVVKTRIMSSSKEVGQSAKIYKAMCHIVQEEGIRSLFKGWLPSYLRLGPHTILTFMLLEQFKAYYQTRDGNTSRIR
ncbi:mitochondrial carrier [Neoconidiobolus thromboides FSU 785]|nr:mitochondrial carrier [Neoconidiobolus thromboides FSU 785]